MFIDKLFPGALKALVLTGFVVASTIAYAGSTIKVSNDSKKNWYLRIWEGSPALMVDHSENSSEAVELGSASNKLFYCIQPGLTCTLTFKETPHREHKAKLQVVDRHGYEKGEIILESKAPHAGHPEKKEQGPEVSAQVNAAVGEGAPMTLSGDTVTLQ